MQFPFVIFRSSPSGAFPSAKTTKRPVLFLTLKRNNLSVNALALVDSGADECLFPASLAGQLGIAIPNQNSFVFSGTADAPQLAYFEAITVQVWNVPLRRRASYNRVHVRTIRGFLRDVGACWNGALRAERLLFETYCHDQQRRELFRHCDLERHSLSLLHKRLQAWAEGTCPELAEWSVPPMRSTQSPTLSPRPSTSHPPKPWS